MGRRKAEEFSKTIHGTWQICFFVAGTQSTDNAVAFINQ